MKAVIFFRHGKSDWGAAFEGDHERPVAKRGRKAAVLMGRFLAASGQAPDSVVTSSAVRARTTVELAHEAGDWGCPIRVTGTLYEANSDSVLREIQAESDSSERLLLAGHEPTFSDSIERLVGQASVVFPTAAMARINFNVSRWRDVTFGAGELVWLIPPKAIKKARWK